MATNPPNTVVPARWAFWTAKGLEILDEERWTDREEWIQAVSRLVPPGPALRAAEERYRANVAERDRRRREHPEKRQLHRPAPTQDELIRSGQRSRAVDALAGLRDSGRVEQRKLADGRAILRRVAPPHEPMSDHEFTITCRRLLVKVDVLNADEMRRFVREAMRRDVLNGTEENG